MVSSRKLFFHKRGSAARLFLFCLIGVLVFGASLSGITVAATPSTPVLTSVPISSGNTLFFASSIDLSSRGYVEEEYLVAGTANIYEYDAGKQVRVKTPNVAYQTRILIRRPTHPGKFNGTVLFEWLNPTAGFDIDFMWQSTNRRILQDGYIWVGITVRPVAINFIKAWNPARYGSLAMSDAGLIYDAVSQLGVLLRDNHSSQNPLSAFNVHRMLGTGYSQSARYLVTYINEFHPDAVLPDGSPAFDGYLVSGANNTARQINSMSGDAGDERRFINAPVPVIRTQTETELALGSATTRLPDSNLYRTYEWAGASHADTENLALTQVVIERDIPGAPPAVCAEENNPLENSPFIRAALVNLNRWVRDGIVPPPAVLINLDSAGKIIRDAHGNAIASLRPPGLEAPLGRHFPLNDGPGPCFLVGSFFPFDEAKLDSLYPSHGHYVSDIARAVRSLVLGRYVLPEDGARYIVDAAQSDVGK